MTGLQEDRLYDSQTETLASGSKHIEPKTQKDDLWPAAKQAEANS